MKTELRMTVVRIAFLMSVFALAVALSGCLSIKVEDLGYEPLRDKNGEVLVDKDGKAQIVHKGQVCIASRGKVKKLYLEVSPERNRE